MAADDLDGAHCELWEKKDTGSQAELNGPKRATTAAEPLSYDDHRVKQAPWHQPQKDRFRPIDKTPPSVSELSSTTSGVHR